MKLVSTFVIGLIVAGCDGQPVPSGPCFFAPGYADDGGI
jgi:hypothetical protein